MHLLLVSLDTFLILLVIFWELNLPLVLLPSIPALFAWSAKRPNQNASEHVVSTLGRAWVLVHGETSISSNTFSLLLIAWRYRVFAIWHDCTEQPLSFDQLLATHSLFCTSQEAHLSVQTLFDRPTKWGFTNFVQSISPPLCGRVLCNSSNPFRWIVIFHRGHPSFHISLTQNPAYKSSTVTGLMSDFLHYCKNPPCRIQWKKSPML